MTDGRVMALAKRVSRVIRTECCRCFAYPFAEIDLDGAVSKLVNV